MPLNALAREKSPYLRQHASNPVDWLPWGEQAFNKARAEDKPIFLSIGYSTCHWCHVMAHESFEDASTAEVLNRYFVSVKLDREERPDIDRIYMLFVQASTGSGGWPMSVWLTPELQPFFGGTYFPPDNRYGRPGFRSLLLHLAQSWQQDRARIAESGRSVAEQLQTLGAPTGSNPHVTLAEVAQSAFLQFRRSFDSVHGGFGQAPKFPRPAALHFLLRYAYSGLPDEAEREEAVGMVTKTLDGMAAGGIHDQLGGGFHRYSVDERWFVPHFEKMLYDQAQLASLYLDTAATTGMTHYSQVADQILTYSLRDLRSEEGGFYSGEDADSADPENPAHHGEGSFYIWRQNEIASILGNQLENETTQAFLREFGVQPDGNVEADPHGEFEGRNILFRQLSSIQTPLPNDLAAVAAHLFTARATRPRPHLDNKVLTSWNGLMISALARAGTSRLPTAERYRNAASKAADFILDTLWRPQSQALYRRYCEGEAAVSAFADDYAFLAMGLLDLFVATGEPRHFKTAFELCLTGLKNFEDTQDGGWFSTEADAPGVLFRAKDEYDGAEPSATAVAIELLLRLWHLTGDNRFERSALRAERWMVARTHRQSSASPHGLASALRNLTPPEQVVIRSAIVSEQALALAHQYRSRSRPFQEVVIVTDLAVEELRDTAPFLATLPLQGNCTVYECRNFACDLPRVIP